PALLSRRIFKERPRVLQIRSVKTFCESFTYRGQPAGAAAPSRDHTIDPHQYLFPTPGARLRDSKKIHGCYVPGQWHALPLKPGVLASLSHWHVWLEQLAARPIRDLDSVLDLKMDRMSPE